MTRLSLRSRALLSACAYVSMGSVVIAGAFFATLALAPVESAAAPSPRISVEKIGPGYARMRPIDLGKPDKVAYSTPYYPHVKTPKAAKAKLQRTAPIVVAEFPAATAPTKIAAADRSAYRLADIHRVY